MKPCAKIVALILVMAGMTSALAAQIALTQSSPQQPAGCHGHGNKVPVRLPEDHACCVAGHESAILRASFAATAAWQSTFAELFVAPTRAEVATCIPISRLASWTIPPGISPLRV
jgi:hypothetical protein